MIQKKLKTLLAKIGVLTFLMLAILPGKLEATHIVGGELNYRCLGNDRYEVILTVRRDCKLGDQAAGFDDPASIGVYDGNNILQTNLFLGGQILLDLNTSDTLNEILVSDCAVFIGDVCVHTTTYKDTVVLPFLASGYILAYQRCCRNSTILNIVDPLETGMTLTTRITSDALTGCNSSAQFNQLTPIYICANEPISFDHAATDADGDSLVYRLCTPLLGGDSSPFGSKPQPPSAPPYPEVTHSAGYSVENMMGGPDALSIDQNTGLLTGTPPIVGQFVIGVCIEEYRDGILISTSRRDFQYNVRNCIDLPQANFEPDQLLNCENLEVAFTNNSLNAPLYHWYFDYPGDLVNPPGSTMENPTHTYPAGGSYTVALVALFDENCSDTAFVDVEVYESQLAADFSAAANSCVEEVELVLTDASTDPGFTITNWNWSISTTEGTLTSNMQNPLFIIGESQTSIVKLVVTSENGCIDSVETSLDLNVIDVEVVSADTTICAGASLELIANTNSTFEYTWSPTTGLDDPTSSNPTATPDSSTTYTVNISDGLCIVNQSIRVNIAPPLQVDRPDWFIACLGDTLTVPITDLGLNNRFIWMPNPVIVDGLLTSNPRVVSDTPGEVQLNYFVLDEFDCNLRDSITVRFEGIIDFELEDTTITCIGNTVPLNPNGNPAYTYIWEPADLLDDATAMNPIADVNESTLFSVTVTNPEKPTCKFEDEIQVFTPSLFDLNAGSERILCEIQEINLEATSGGYDLTYEWFDGDMVSIGEGQIISITPTETDTYTVVASNPFGCRESSTVTVIVSLFDPPISITASPDTIVIGESTQLQATTGDGFTYSWEGPNLSATDISNPIATPQTTASYSVTVTNEFGCQEIATIAAVTVLNPDCNEEDVFLPNAFSPNGDGMNDIFYVRSNFVDDLDLIIYNRWGENVFEVNNVQADDPSVGWNGVFKGEELKPDVFGYYLRARCVNGREFLKKGNVTLLK